MDGCFRGQDGSIFASMVEWMNEDMTRLTDGCRVNL